MIAGCASPSKILIYRGGGLGDFLAIVPLIHLLRMQDRNTTISVMGPQCWLPILRWSPVDFLYPAENYPFWALISRNKEVSAPLVKFLSEFDKIFWFADPGSELGRTLTDHFSQKIRCMAPFPLESESISIFEHIGLICGSDIGFKIESLPLPLLVIPEMKDARFDGNLIAWHPGSGSVRKCWPMDRALWLMKELQQSFDMRIGIVLGPAEQKIPVNEITNSIQCEIWQGLSVEDLGKRLAGAGFFWGNDSGISHLSAFLGLQGILMKGPLYSGTWKPFGNALVPVDFETPDERLLHLMSRIIIDSRSQVK